MTCHLIDLVKQVFPDTKIFVGGPEVSYTARQILEDYEHIDYVLQGKGKTWCRPSWEILAAGRGGTEVPGVLGRVHGVIQGDETFQEVEDLDSLPFLMNTRISANWTTASCTMKVPGLPFHCQYCLSGMNDRVRFRSVPLVLKELQAFVDAGVHQVKFVDRTTTAVPLIIGPSSDT